MAVGVADFNGDHRLDLVTANGFDDTASVLLGNGDGTFRAHIDFAAGSSPFALVTADFNHDGSPDLAVADYGGTVSVLLNTKGRTGPSPVRQIHPRKVKPLTFTATVAASVKGAGMPTGTVTFRTDDDKRTAKLVAGVATYTTAKLTIGKHRVIADYSGDSQFAPRDSGPIVQIVQP
jgi:hypothetical protein